MSLTNPGVKRSPGVVKAGDLCSSCSSGKMLTWQGALRCRSCGNTAEIGATSSAAGPSAVSARSIAPRMPAASRPSIVTNPAAIAPRESEPGALQIGELCGACYKGRMLTWEGSLKCRSCGTTAEIAGSAKSLEAKAPVASARPAAKLATRSASREQGVREPNRTAAAITGVGLFIGLYVTIGLCTVANMLLL